MELNPGMQCVTHLTITENPRARKAAQSLIFTRYIYFYALRIKIIEHAVLELVWVAMSRFAHQTEIAAQGNPVQPSNLPSPQIWQWWAWLCRCERRGWRGWRRWRWQCSDRMAYCHCSGRWHWQGHHLGLPRCKHQRIQKRVQPRIFFTKINIAIRQVVNCLCASVHCVFKSVCLCRARDSGKTYAWGWQRCVIT